MQVEVEIQTKKIKTFGIFQVIIINNAKGLKAMGKPLCDWLLDSCKKYPTKIIDWQEKSVLELIAPHISQVATHSIVLFSSTPLLSESTIEKIVEYVVVKNVKACKLPIGMVFNNEYLKSATAIEYDSIFAHFYDEFYNVENKTQLNKISEFFRTKILDKHIANGVNIISPATTTIEASVVIDSEVDIFANNTLQGKTVVEKGVILKEGNVIINSLIKEGSCLINSRIEDSKLGKNVYIKAFCSLKDSKIKNNTILESYTNLVKNNKSQ